jgi:DNA mismatch endonuclease (patch repair protein)
MDCTLSQEHKDLRMGHGRAEHFRRPNGNRGFWDAKIERNRERGVEVTRALRKAGWRVLRLWENELAKKSEKRLPERLRRWLSCLKQPALGVCE